MSRIGKRAVALDAGVEVKEKDGGLEVKGPKGVLFEALPEGISVQVEGGALHLKRASESKTARARHGLARALVQNMVTGVTQGFARKLEINGVGYRAEARGRTLHLTVGLSHPVEMPVPEGLTLSVQENIIEVKGSNLQRVGQFAAEVRRVRPPEPYKGKGIRYVDEHVRRKVGKTAVG